MGLSKADVLAIMCMNSPQYVICMLGAFKFGITVTPVSAAYKPDEIARQLIMSNAKKILTERKFLPMVLDAVKDIESKHTLFMNYF